MSSIERDTTIKFLFWWNFCAVNKSLYERKQNHYVRQNFVFFITSWIRNWYYSQMSISSCHWRSKKQIDQEICIQKNVFERTKKYWLHQRFVLKNAINRQTKKYQSDRKQKISNKHLNQLLDQDNLVRNQHYECQIDHFNKSIHFRILKKALISKRNVRKYKMIVVKIINEKRIASSIWKWALQKNHKRILSLHSLNEQSSCEFSWSIFRIHFAWKEYKI
jgi:hypothetical protein